MSSSFFLNRKGKFRERAGFIRFSGLFIIDSDSYGIWHCKMLVSNIGDVLEVFVKLLGYPLL